VLVGLSLDLSPNVGTTCFRFDAKSVFDPAGERMGGEGRQADGRRKRGRRGERRRE